MTSRSLLWSLRVWVWSIELPLIHLTSFCKKKKKIIKLFCCWTRRNVPQKKQRHASATGNGSSWTQSWLRTQRVGSLWSYKWDLCLTCRIILISFHNCVAELFQDLSQLQEIWIAEGESCKHYVLITVVKMAQFNMNIVSSVLYMTNSGESRTQKFQALDHNTPLNVHYFSLFHSSGPWRWAVCPRFPIQQLWVAASALIFIERPLGCTTGNEHFVEKHTHFYLYLFLQMTRSLLLLWLDKKILRKHHNKQRIDPDNKNYVCLKPDHFPLCNRAPFC